MTVFKYFIKVAFDYRAVILGYAVLFLVFAMLAASDSSSQDEWSFQVEKQEIGIVNNSDSELSNALVDYLENEHNIVNIEYDEDYIKEQIFLEQVNAVVIIPEDFQESVINKEETIEIFRDESRIGPYQVQNQINKFIAFANGTYTNGEFQLENISNVLSNSVEVSILDSDNGIDKDADTWFQSYYNFSSYIIMSLYITVIGMVMSDFNVKEVEHRRKISSISLLKFNREIYLAQLVVGVFLTSIFIIASIIIRASYISQVNYTKYILNTWIFSLTALCLVFLIINITTNKYAITAIGNILSLGLSFISGVFVPQEFLSANVLNIAKFSPVYYFVSINNKDVRSFIDVRFEISMQLLFALAFLMVGLYISRVKQKA